jgi:hypothetical protein
LPGKPEIKTETAAPVRKTRRRRDPMLMVA